MTANKSVAHRLGRVLETVTRQSGRLPTTPEYGSWLLGKEIESQPRRRMRIQIILTVFILFTNLIGIVVATLVVPSPSRCRACSTDVPRGSLRRRRRPTSVALVSGPSGSTRRIVNVAAVGDRGANTESNRPAQHVPGAVAR